MVDPCNEKIRAGVPMRVAVVGGTKDRFRPILHTSLTTILGVCPMTLETSLQAQCLIPLAAAIGYGVLLGMFLIVLAVPALFVLLHFLGTRRHTAWRALSGVTPAPDVSGNEDRARNNAPPTTQFAPVVTRETSRALAAE